MKVLCLPESKDSIDKICTRCQTRFTVDRKYGYQRMCPTCFKLSNANFAGEKRIVAKHDGGKAELKSPNSAVPTLKPFGFNDDAALPELKALLEACWRAAHEFKPKPQEEQCASLAATLFIAQTRRRWE